MKCLLILYFCLVLLPVSATEVSGKAIAFACSGCHGTDGQLTKPGIPKLKSQPTIKLEQSLLNFKYNKKPSSIMGRIARGYTDNELKAVAQYFSHLN